MTVIVLQTFKVRVRGVEHKIDITSEDCEFGPVPGLKAKLIKQFGEGEFDNEAGTLYWTPNKYARIT